MKVLSAPHVTELGGGESGIHTVIRSYYRLAKDYGIDFVDPGTDSFDVLAIHAGMAGHYPPAGNIVAHTHGLYWTADFDFGRWAFSANRAVVDSVRHAKIVTVPSDWVAETFRRDMRMSPEIVPHGIIWNDWQHDEEKGGYVVIYAKNRAGVDVCNPSFIPGFAARFPKVNFVSTFCPKDVPNVKVTGVVSHDRMKKIVQQSSVFISTTKETWGIAMLEALASGVPVLAFKQGGAIDLVVHGVNGYLARPDDYADLADGLEYCIAHSKVLGDNAREMAKAFSWDSAMLKLRDVYEAAMRPDPATVSVVIPVYNKSGEELSRAVTSAKNQTRPVDEIIIVNDGSTIDVDYEGIARDFGAIYVEQNNSGVAAARNTGVAAAGGKYILCLDADDAISAEFIEACIPELEADNSLGIAYTGLRFVLPDTSTGVSEWPGEFNYDDQIDGKNQVPTACVFRKEAFDRVGGYHKRYAPQGAGEEDANLWLRIPSIGYNARKVSDAGLFIYSWQSGSVSGNKDHTPTDWRYMLPWTRDGLHPFASVAKPKTYSHPVHQYDEPAVGVVIPVGPGHELSVRDALDALESQTFRKWEAIVVWDSPDMDALANLVISYPYIRVVVPDEPRPVGAGRARNLGVAESRSAFTLYLDADDTIHPDCMERMLEVYGTTGEAVYTDYMGTAVVDDVTRLAKNLQRSIVSHNKDTNVAIIEHELPDFDCERALRQPEKVPYIWNNVTTLFPTSWHDEIGGFDESMDSWEDIDYWWRMAWAGKCFTRIAEPLMSYKFSTGSRRQKGLADYDNLMEYLRQKRAEMI